MANPCLHMFFNVTFPWIRKTKQPKRNNKSPYDWRSKITSNLKNSLRSLQTGQICFLFKIWWLYIYMPINYAKPDIGHDFKFKYIFFIYFFWNKIKNKKYHTAKQFQNTITHPYKEENSIHLTKGKTRYT